MKQVYWLLAKQFFINVLPFSIFFIFPFFSLGLLVFGMIGANPLFTIFVTAILLVTYGSIGDFCTGSLREKLVQAKILDNPNLRSMHTQPVPRGGGWVFVLPLAAFLLFSLGAVLIITHEAGYMDVEKRTLFFTHIAFSIGFLLITAISWLDDQKNISARWRLFVQFAATALAIYFFLPALNNIFPLWILPPVVFCLLTILWVGFINLYNFMDGIDGITGIETISIGFPIYLILIPLHSLFLPTPIPSPMFHLQAPLLGLIITGISFGFLYHNWYPAKIFLGDIGSVTLGYVVGFCLLSVAGAGFWYVALTLPLYYLADGGITLARRILRGEKFWEAHRTHFYQRAAQAAGRHDVVVLKIAACNVVLIGIAMLELLVSPWFVLAAPLPVALLLHNMAHQRHIGVKSPNG